MKLPGIRSYLPSSAHVHDMRFRRKLHSFSSWIPASPVMSMYYLHNLLRHHYPNIAPTKISHIGILSFTQTGSFLTMATEDMGHIGGLGSERRMQDA